MKTYKFWISQIIFLVDVSLLVWSSKLVICIQFFVWKSSLEFASVSHSKRSYLFFQVSFQMTQEQSQSTFAPVTAAVFCKISWRNYSMYHKNMKKLGAASAMIKNSAYAQERFCILLQPIWFTQLVFHIFLLNPYLYLCLPTMLCFASWDR